MRVWRADGRPAGAAHTLRTSAWVWDWTTHALVAVSGDRVVRTDGSAVETVARMHALDVVPSPGLAVTPLGGGLIELSTASRIAVVNRTGRVLARARIPAGWRFDGALAATASGAIAYEATPTEPLPAHEFRLYAGLPGRATTVIDRYEVPPECVYHEISVRGSTVLLASQGIARAYDLRDGHARVDLEPAVRWLQARHRTGRPSFV
jgi:hypothetical protein